MFLEALLLWISGMMVAGLGAGIAAPTLAHQDGNRYVIRNMDFVFIAQNAPGAFKAGEPPKLVILQYDNNKVPMVPFQMDGQWLWEAFECVNMECPHFKEAGKAFVFPRFDEKRLERAKKPNAQVEWEDLEWEGLPPSCPLCEKANVDAYRVERYMTEKAKAEQKAMVEKILRENP